MNKVYVTFSKMPNDVVEAIKNKYDGAISDNGDGTSNVSIELFETTDEKFAHGIIYNNECYISIR